MGATVLSAQISPASLTHVRSYAHCAPHGGVTVLLLNLGTSSESVAVHLDDVSDGAAHATDNQPRANEAETRFEWHGTADSILSQSMRLNGKVLSLQPGGHLPPMEPVATPADSEVALAPHSWAFVQLPHVHPAVCSSGIHCIRAC